MKINIYFLVACFFAAYFSAVKGNTPALLEINRNWVVQEDDPIGLVVERVSAYDQEGDPVVYQFSAPSFGQDGSKFFAVDSSGRVRVQKSLENQGGKTFFVKVTAYDGKIRTSAEIRVQVKRSQSQSVSFLPHKNPNRSGLLGALNPPIPPPLPHPSNGFHGYPIQGSGGFDPRSGQGLNVFTNRAGPPKGTPPVLRLPNSGLWTVNHTVEVGATVDTVVGFDVADHLAPITYAIKDTKGLLSVDPKTGLVKIEKSLLYEVGDHYVMVYVSNEHGTGSGQMIFRVTGPKENQATTPEPSTTLPSQSIEEHPQSRFIAIVNNPPTAPPSLQTLEEDSDSSAESNDIDTSLEVEEVFQKTNYQFMVIGLPLFGLSALVVALAWCYKRICKKRLLTKENSSVMYDKKGLELTPVSSASNTLVHGVTPILPTSIRRLWTRRASENSYEENQNAPKLPVRPMTTIDPLKPEHISDEWEFPRHRLKVIGILGEGCFGQVWKYEAQDMKGCPAGKTLVAVKTVKESAQPEDKNDLIQELKVLKSLGTHPNVVSLLACCTEKEPVLVVLEYMIHGKLQTYLRERRSQTPYNNLHGTSSSLSPRDLTIFALQVAKGMDYLSSHGIVHRDLAARNVLVGEDKICKVADFGFARDLANNQVYERKSGGRLPIRWMAIESLFDNIFSTKTDVWSFGILLWEIVTLGSTPYPGIIAEVVMNKIRDGYRLEKPDYCRREVYNIMYYCWYENPVDRPTFKELIKHLEDLITSEVDYIEINKFPERCYYNVNTAPASGELL